MKYTITRALSELKSLKDRYAKEISRMNLIAVKHGAKLRQPNSSYKEEDFCEEAKAVYQSVCDLEKRIEEIKNKIDFSNFTTKVTVGDKEMTVQEALNIKNNVISLKESRLSYMKSLRTQAQNSFDRALDENKARIEKISSDKSTSTLKAGDVEKDAVDFVEKLYAVELVDPIKLDDQIKALEKEIIDFRGNIDYVLSESNSITTIEVSD
jgi:hypothetical protein